MASAVTAFSLPEWYMNTLREDYDFKVQLETYGIDRQEIQSALEFINRISRNTEISWHDARNYFLMRLKQGARTHAIFIEMLR